MVKGVGVKATSGVRGDPPLVPVGRGVSSAAGKHWTIYVLYEPEMPFKSDDKSGKVGRTFPDFDF